MKRFLVKVVINAIAFWLTTLVVGLFSANRVFVTPYGDGGTLETILTYLLVGLIFGIVNGVLGTIIRVVALPLYILTLGLLALVVNSLLLMLVAWISGQLGFGLTVDDFWWGVLAAIFLGIFSAILGAFARPLTRESRTRRR